MQILVLFLDQIRTSSQHRHLNSEMEQESALHNPPGSIWTSSVPARYLAFESIARINFDTQGIDPLKHIKVP